MGPSASRKVLRFPLRPGQRQTRIKCVVKANHFFSELSDKDLNWYDVSLTLEVVSRSVYRESDFGMRLPIYNRKILYTAGILAFTSKDFKIKIVHEDDGINGPKLEKFKESKCPHIVSTDRGKEDVSYLKWLKNFLKEKPLEHAESFCRKYFGQNQS